MCTLHEFQRLSLFAKFTVGAEVSIHEMVTEPPEGEEQIHKQPIVLALWRSESQKALIQDIRSLSNRRFLTIEQMVVEH